MGTDEANLSETLRGRPFVKMTGSGNDFVFFDSRGEGMPPFMPAATIERLCARGTGVGADGVVFLVPERGYAFRMVYLNADGSRAAMCGNAALCSTRLALEGGQGGEITFLTDSGPVAARLRDGQPEIDLSPIEVVRAGDVLPVREGELRIGFTVAGVPHVTVLCDDVEKVDVVRRGREIRLAEELRPEGANANFVSKKGKHPWRIRTYERGVESETLACGTGAVASALLLQEWGKASSPVTLQTRAGLPLTVRFRQDGSRWLPSLSGEGRIVFRGELAEF